ncbi:unnamed protein product [Urochloa humidicola]
MVGWLNNSLNCTSVVLGLPTVEFSPKNKRPDWAPTGSCRWRRGCMRCRCIWARGQLHLSARPPFADHSSDQKNCEP